MEQAISIDPELAHDLLGELDDAHIALASVVAKAEKNLHNLDYVDEQFRVVHSIKGNLRMVCLNRMSDSVHKLENLLEQIRDQQITPITGLYHALFLLIGEQVELVRRGIHQESIAREQAQMEFLVDVVADAEQQTLSSAIENVLYEYDPDAYKHHQSVSNSPSEEVTPLAEVEEEPANQHKLSEDLSFFQDVILRIEDYFPHWRGRSQRIVNLCVAMNENDGARVNKEQLITAAYLHDFGMSLIPPDIVRKTGQPNSEEELILQSHCDITYEWLRRIPGWGEAASMVLQHHERPDGKGYPYGLQDSAICDGAKILAIADAYEAITNQRHFREGKSSKIMAIMEITRNAGTQFSEHWVNVFNDTIKQL